MKPLDNEEKDESVLCCPPFEPALWDDKLIEWQNKRFIKDSVFTMFYMPITFSKVMKRLKKKISAANAKMPDWLCLSDHTSKWNMDVYLAVDKDIPTVNNITLSGKYYSKVYEGNFKDTGKWCKDFESVTKSKGFSIKKWFMWYTTCPKCARKYGKNYVAIISEVE
jgi:hypothetical protein